MSSTKPPETPARILAVDDEQAILNAYCRLLRKAGYEVQTATSAEKALHLLQEQAYDLILLDLRMPGMGGMELLRPLRRQKQTPDVLILDFCSARQGDVMGVLVLGRGKLLPTPGLADAGPGVSVAFGKQPEALNTTASPVRAA